MNIIITGSSKGIGRAVALSFSKKEDHTLFLISRDLKKLEALKDECNTINPKCKIYLYSINLCNISRQNGLLNDLVLQSGKIDILINNAGILHNKKFETISDQEIESMLSTNFLAPASLIRHLIPCLLKAEKAHVVNIGSMGGFQGSSKFSGLAYYSASKAALAVLTECLAEEFKNTKISFNCLALGSVQTEMFSNAFPEALAPVKAAEIADFIVNFSLSAHYFVNGKILPISISNPC